MNRVKFLLCVNILVFYFCSVSANVPKAYLGKYGIEWHSSLEEYQQKYIGQIVTYVQGKSQLFCSNDRKFQKAGGDFSKEYIIKGISGSNQLLKFELQEKNGKKKIKLRVNNHFVDYLYTNDWFCITKDFTIPLLLKNKYEEDKISIKGKEYGNYTISDLMLVYPQIKGYDEFYPTVKIQVKDKLSNHIDCFELNEIDALEKGVDFIGKIYPHNNTQYKYEVIGFNLHANKQSSERYTLVLKDGSGNVKKYKEQYISDLDYLGKEYENDKYWHKYTVIDVQRNDEQKLELTLNNSLNNLNKIVLAENENNVFVNDDSGKFYAALKKVDKPANSSVRYGKKTSITENNITKYGYIDNIIDIQLFVELDKFIFKLKNLSTNTIKIIWDEAVFVDVDGTTSKVMHKGVKYSQREENQPASTIIKGAILEDIILPTTNVWYSSSSNEWDTYSIFKEALSYKWAGKSLEKLNFKLMLPIQIKDVINEYIFEFEVFYRFDHPEYFKLM